MKSDFDTFVRPCLVSPGKRISLEDFDPAYKGEFTNRESADEELKRDIDLLSENQQKLYAQNTYAILVILQGMDTAGKDSTIKHVMSGVSPQGCQVFSFKQPSAEELDHDYLWRTAVRLPERGRIGIFNRSYYEEVLVVRVHPELLEAQRLPPDAVNDRIWQRRFEEINHFEKYLVDNGTIVLKFFLNISKKEQKKRFLARIDEPEKHWKFSLRDVEERGHWDDYMQAYEDAFNHTSTKWAPWYIVPADHKWFTRIAVARIIGSRMQSLNLAYPIVSKEYLAQLQKAKEMLLKEP